MKCNTLSGYLTFSILALMLAVSCKKTQMTTPAPTVSKYRVTHVTDTTQYLFQGIVNETIVYDYDITYTNNRIAKVHVGLAVYYNTGIPTFDSATRVFVFHDSSYIIHYLPGTTMFDSIQLNKAYLITDVQGPDGASFSYNSNFQLINFEQSIGLFLARSRCIWNNSGNIAAIISDNDTSTITYYMDKPNTIGNILGISNFTSYGNPIFFTKNLTKSIVSRLRTIDADYVFDQNNNIIKTGYVQTNYNSDNTIFDVVIRSYHLTYERY